MRQVKQGPVRLPRPVGVISLFFASTITLNCLSPIAQATPINTAAINPSPPADPDIVHRNTAFWSAVEKILATQAQWFERAELAAHDLDPQETQILRTKLLVQLRSIDLFVQRYSRMPQAICHSQSPSAHSALAPGLALDQQATYCAIYQLSRDLTPLHQHLIQRSARFRLEARTAESTAQFFTQSKLAPLATATVEPASHTHRLQTEPPSPIFVYPQMVGSQRIKQWQAGDRGTIAPAITPHPELLQRLNQGQIQLAQVQATLPTSSPLFAAKSLPVGALQKPQQAKQPIAKFAVPPAEAIRYRTFLGQPQTGIDQVYPATAFVPTQNRLNPVNVPMPFGLRLEDGKFLLGGEAINYGFMTDIGNINLADVRVDQGLPQLFHTYTPPTTLAAIQQDQRRFLLGKDTPLSSVIAAKLNHTYVMRLVQYRLPELVTTGRLLQPGERSQLKSLLQHCGNDRIIAFRPVARGTDGSYTILWKVLETQSVPQITDLKDYISTNLQTRTRY